MRKRLLIIPAMVLTLSISVGAYALTSRPPTTKKVALVEQLAPTTTTPKPKSSSITTPKKTTAVPQSQIQTDSAIVNTDPPAPLYGEDPTQPGVYVVFDKTQVMGDAGIPADQQDSASTLLQKRMNWIYHRDDALEANICYIAPIKKLASAGSDYRTNPVTQLKWCNSYVIARYGTWGAALDYFNENDNF